MANKVFQFRGNGFALGDGGADFIDARRQLAGLPAQRPLLFFPGGQGSPRASPARAVFHWGRDLVLWGYGGGFRLRLLLLAVQVAVVVARIDPRQPAVDLDDLVGHLADERAVVGHQADRAPVVAQGVGKNLARRDVQVVGRLVP